MASKENNQYKQFITILLGVVLLVVGITLTLKWWADVVVLFRGVIGVALAFAGMLVLYLAKK
jgi:hypothetical protein